MRYSSRKLNMKKKLISTFILICLLHLLLFAYPITASANSSDVIGLDSGFEYYIRNSSTGKYLDVDHGIVENGRNILEYSYNGGTNQKWLIYKLSDGQYKIVSALNQDYCLDIKSDGNAILYKYKASSNEKYNITRTGGGTYNIKNNSKYVSVSNGNVQVMTSYPTGTWSFERVYRGEIQMFTNKYDGYDNTTENTNVMFFFSKMNYQYSEIFVNVGKSYALSRMPTSHIWVFRGHAAPGVLQFTTVDSSNSLHHSYIYNSDINSLSTNALSTERVMIVGGCSTGANSDSSSTSTIYNNLVDAMYEKGAHFSIGWTDTIPTAQGTKWVKCFFESASKGNSISTAMLYADANTQMCDSYYVGDIFANLTH